MRPRIVAALRRRRRFDLDVDDSAEVDRQAARLPGQLRLLRALLRLHPLARRRGAARTRRETAVLNANYLLARLRELGVAEQLPLAFGELCMHEFVLSGAPMKRELQIRTLDLAKRLLDHGFHPPTVYFPLLVDEALLIEPTETETRETLDALRRRAGRDPARGRRGPDDRPQRAVHDAGAPPRRGGGGEAAGHPPGAVDARGAVARLRRSLRRLHGECGAADGATRGRRPGVGGALDTRRSLRRSCPTTREQRLASVAITCRPASRRALRGRPGRAPRSARSGPMALARRA